MRNHKLIKPITSFLAAALLAASLPTIADAGLTMVIDTSAKELWYTGTDSGTWQGDFISDVQWASGTLTGTSAIVQTDLARGLSHDNADGSYGYWITVYSNNGITLSEDSPKTTLNGTITAEGDSYKLSYATLSGANQTILESYIGTDLTLTIGTGFQPLSIISAPVPEPSDYAFASGFGVIALALLRRRQR